MPVSAKSSVSLSNARGEVSFRWVGPDGPSEPARSRNTMSYLAATAVAAAYGGDTSLVPCKIGFIYGPDGYAPRQVSGRSMTWQALETEMETTHGNVLLSEFSASPTISVTEETGSDDQPLHKGEYLEGNSVTFHAFTRSGSAGTYAFNTADPLADGDVIAHVVLLGRDGSGCGEGRYRILARASLADSNGNYRKKPEDYELALDWKVTFF